MLPFPNKSLIGTIYIPIWKLPEKNYKHIKVWAATSGWIRASVHNGMFFGYFTDIAVHPSYYYTGDMVE